AGGSGGVADCLPGGQCQQQGGVAFSPANLGHCWSLRSAVASLFILPAAERRASRQGYGQSESQPIPTPRVATAHVVGAEDHHALGRNTLVYTRDTHPVPWTVAGGK